MSRQYRLRRHFALVIGGTLAIACTDGSGVGPRNPELAILNPAQPGDGQAQLERFEVCKEYVGEVGPAVTIDIEEDIGSNGSVDATGSVTLADGECKEIQVIGPPGATVTVTEQVPTGYTASWEKTVISGTTGNTTTSTTSGSGNEVSGPVSENFGTLVIFTNTKDRGNQGCTPGYWKQPQHLDSWTTYTPNQLAGSVFNLAGYPTLASKTLLATLDGTGGPGTLGAASILLRAAVAAILNAESAGVDYPQLTADIIADVNAALASNDRATMLALAAELDADNNLGCPLN